MVPPHFNWFYVFMFITGKLIYARCTCEDDSLYLIRSTASNLVVEASLSKITIQHFDGYTPQLWKFKHGSRPGLYFIINNSTGTALDVGSNLQSLLLSKENRDSLNQQWIINSNGRIENAGINKNLDISGGRYVPGNPLIVHPYNGDKAQDFIVKEKRTCR